MSLSHLAVLPERRTASDNVADMLREAIITGQFEDGEELNQVELARHFNVSRVPVREALRQLQAEGLVTAEAHRRVVVPGVDPERIAETFEIRARLETFMLARAAPQLTKGDLAALRARCDAMDAIDDQGKWLEANHDFHNALFERSEAPIAMELVNRLSRQVERYLRRSGGVIRREDAGSEHRKILRALGRGDHEAAQRLLSDHILQTLKTVLASLPPREADG